MCHPLRPADKSLRSVAKGEGTEQAEGAALGRKQTAIKDAEIASKR